MELSADGLTAATIAHAQAMLGQVPNTGNLIYAMGKAIERYVEVARTPAKCQARQYSDQMQCGRCGLAWDVNDPEPPPCSPTERRIAPRRADALVELFEPDGLPGQWDKPVRPA